MVTSERHERSSTTGSRGAFRSQLAPRPTDLSAQLAHETHWGGGLLPVVHLAQSAPLVEATAQLLQRAVLVRVHHRSLGHIGLGVAGPQHVDREHPVLGIGDLAKRHLFPGSARNAGVGVGEEATPADQLDGRQRALAL